MYLCLKLNVQMPCDCNRTRSPLEVVEGKVCEVVCEVRIEEDFSTGVFSYPRHYDRSRDSDRDLEQERCARDVLEWLLRDFLGLLEDFLLLLNAGDRYRDLDACRRFSLFLDDEGLIFFADRERERECERRFLDTLDPGLDKRWLGFSFDRDRRPELRFSSFTISCIYKDRSLSLEEDELIFGCEEEGTSLYR